MNQRLELTRLARDTSYNLIRQGLAVLIGMAISILLARGLGKEARGIYALAALFPELLITFLNLGIGMATIYFTGRGEYKPLWSIQQNIALAFWISLLTVGIGLLLSLLAGERLFPGVPLVNLLLAMLLIPINLFVAYLNTILHGMQDFRTFNLVWVTSQLLFLAFVLILVTWLRKGVSGALLALLSANLGGLIYLLLHLSKKFQFHKLFSLRVDPQYLRRILGYGLKAHLGSVITFLNYRADNFILNFLGGPAQVGLYSVAVGLGERLWIPSNAVGAVILPRIAALGQDEETRKQLTPLSARTVFLLSLLMAFVVYALARWGVVLLYSPEYQASAAALRCLLPGIVMLNMTRLLANDIAGRGRPELNLYQSVAALAVNIIANLLLIPRWGAIGAALASTISYSFLAILTIKVYCNLASVPWLDVLLITRSDLTQYKKALKLILHKEISQSTPR